MKSFLQFNEDAVAAHKSRTAGLGKARSGTEGGSYHKPSKRRKTGIGKFLKDKIKQIKKPEFRSKSQQQKQKSSALTKRPESRHTEPVQKVKVGVQQDKKKALPASKQKKISGTPARKQVSGTPERKALPASQPRLTPAEKQKRLSSSAQRKALPPARS